MIWFLFLLFLLYLILDLVFETFKLVKLRNFFLLLKILIVFILAFRRLFGCFLDNRTFLLYFLSLLLFTIRVFHKFINTFGRLFLLKLIHFLAHFQLESTLRCFLHFFSPDFIIFSLVSLNFPNCENNADRLDYEILGNV